MCINDNNNNKKKTPRRRYRFKREPIQRQTNYPAAAFFTDKKNQTADRKQRTVLDGGAVLGVGGGSQA